MNTLLEYQMKYHGNMIPSAMILVHMYWALLAENCVRNELAMDEQHSPGRKRSHCPYSHTASEVLGSSKAPVMNWAENEVEKPS